MQHPLTILGQLDGDLPAKRSRLRELADRLDRRDASFHWLLSSDWIHFLSFFVIDAREGLPAYVALEISCDVPPRSARKRLSAGAAAAFLDALFEGCEGYEEQPTESGRSRFLARNDAGADAYYLAFPGRGVTRIREEDQLRASVRAAYEAQLREGWPGTASAFWRNLQGARGQDAADPEPLPFFVRWPLHLPTLRWQLAPVVKLCAWALAIAAGALGLYGLLLERGTRALGFWAACAFGASALLVAFCFERSAPRRLSWRARPYVWLSALWQWLLAGLAISLVMGVFALPATPPPPLPRLAELASGLPLGAIACALCALAFVGAVTLLGYVALGGLWALLIATVLASGSALLVAALWESPLVLALWGTAAAVAVLLIAAALVLRWLYVLRKAEIADPEGDLSWDLDHLDAIQQREDHPDRTHQNHLATVSELKGGRLRLYTLRMVLRLVSLLARVHFTRGDLGGIRTIHHARFLILPDRRRLLFLGNYDLAFSSYLQEFNSVPGVTAVWSNTVGFPRAFLLLGEGARDEQRFKAFARRCQVPTIGWFSAYPGLAITDIEAAAATREALLRTIADPSTLKGRMRMRFGRPMTEADCDAALRRL